MEMQEALFNSTFGNIRKSGKQCLVHADFNLSQKVFFQGNQMWKTRDKAEFFNRKQVQVLGNPWLASASFHSNTIFAFSAPTPSLASTLNTLPLDPASHVQVLGVIHLAAPTLPFNPHPLVSSFFNIPSIPYCMNFYPSHISIFECTAWELPPCSQLSLPIFLQPQFHGRCMVVRTTHPLSCAKHRGYSEHSRLPSTPSTCTRIPSATQAISSSSPEET